MGERTQKIRDLIAKGESPNLKVIMDAIHYDIEELKDSTSRILVFAQELLEQTTRLTILLEQHTDPPNLDEEE